MDLIPTPIPGVVQLRPKVFGDQRGFFCESWNARNFREATGVDASFVQDNHSRSAAGVLRGLHFQYRHSQGKLVRVTHGTVWDVVVDLRRDSPSFGTWFACELSGENHLQLWIPPGLAHGFLVLSTSADFLYKTSDYWMPQFERSLSWNDPSVAIDWPLERIEGGSGPVLAPKDASAPSLAQLLGEGLIPLA